MSLKNLIGKRVYIIDGADNPYFITSFVAGSVKNTKENIVELDPFVAYYPKDEMFFSTKGFSDDYKGPKSILMELYSETEHTEKFNEHKERVRKICENREAKNLKEYLEEARKF